ncbi:MAG: sn-glycerol-1-phosphate dehydrogenase [Chloroflexota bacterium]
MGPAARAGSFGRALSEASDTVSVLVACGALASVGEVFRHCFAGHRARVVADATTWGVAGSAIQSQLGAAALSPLILGGEAPLHADFDRVLEIERQLTGEIPIAVGSGTVNDLVKLAADRAGAPYMVAATAASMDGYAAYGAAITRDGVKQTMACAAPRAVVADLDVLAAAPSYLTSWGYGDLIGKVTAGADWLVARAVGAEEWSDAAWLTVQRPLRRTLADPHLTMDGDVVAVERLVTGLVRSGLAMQVMQSSRPASGSEHQLSHLWEMDGHTVAGQSPSHGHKVAVGTVIVSALYEHLLARDLSGVDVERLCERLESPNSVATRVRGSFPAGPRADAAVAESLAKHPESDLLRKRLELLSRRWPRLKGRLLDQLMPVAELRALLRTAACPSTPGDIGIPLDQVAESVRRARQIRRRYTVLDLAAETGLLDELLDEVVTGPHLR